MSTTTTKKEHSAHSLGVAGLFWRKSKAMKKGIGVHGNKHTSQQMSFELRAKSTPNFGLHNIDRKYHLLMRHWVFHISIMLCLYNLQDESKSSQAHWIFPSSSAAILSDATNWCFCPFVCVIELFCLDDHICGITHHTRIKYLYCSLCLCVLLSQKTSFSEWRRSDSCAKRKRLHEHKVNFVRQTNVSFCFLARRSLARFVRSYNKTIYLHMVIVRM